MSPQTQFLLNQSTSYLLSDNLVTAELFLKQAIKLEPKNIDVLRLLGVLESKRGNFDASLSYFNQALKKAPKNTLLNSNKGNALQGLKRYEEAIVAYDQAISTEPNYAEAYSNKGTALERQGFYSKALAFFVNAIEINPNFVDVNFNLSILYLKSGQFTLGWEKYDWRWNSTGFNSLPLISKKSEWMGQRTDDKILVWAEQGIGDQILYSSMFNELKEIAPNLIISVDKKLLEIYKRSFPAITFMDSTHQAIEDSYDKQIAIGSLGKIFRNDIKSFKQSLFPSLIANSGKTSEFRKQNYSLGAVRCGISWKSSNKDIGEDKSIPIHELRPLLTNGKIEFINLQYGDVKNDLEILGEISDQKINFVNEIDLYNDVDSALSLINSCDLIITSSNSNAHMAGALNKKTILILPFEYGKLWYWHGDNGNSLWYPSVKIFSQLKQGDWSEVIEKVRIYMESLSFE